MATAGRRRTHTAATYAKYTTATHSETRTRKDIGG